ncbi:hypothetical protein PR048_009851 [Dryococelus australis]|uniref:Uncharacterized protein n=1 Tax=Dryococelus australis TaxID=614101 RepID=A0ABQ9I135_9NEOP|nr:hypothetical protein PR048_009851 [Dryococelus australis]
MKANMVERFNRNLKNEMGKKFSSQGSYKRMDILPDIKLQLQSKSNYMNEACGHKGQLHNGCLDDLDEKGEEEEEVTLWDLRTKIHLFQEEAAVATHIYNLLCDSNYALLLRGVHNLLAKPIWHSINRMPLAGDISKQQPRWWLTDAHSSQQHPSWRMLLLHFSWQEEKYQTKQDGCPSISKMATRSVDIWDGDTGVVTSYGDVIQDGYQSSVGRKPENGAAVAQGIKPYSGAAVAQWLEHPIVGPSREAAASSQRAAPDACAGSERKRLRGKNPTSEVEWEGAFWIGRSPSGPGWRCGGEPLCRSRDRGSKMVSIGVECGSGKFTRTKNSRNQGLHHGREPGGCAHSLGRKRVRENPQHWTSRWLAAGLNDRVLDLHFHWDGICDWEHPGNTLVPE